jgi:putative transposase
MTEKVRYNYRLRPGAMAERALMDEWHCCRWLWNEAVHQQKAGRKPTLCKLSKLLTEARGQHEWLRAGSRVAQAQTLRTFALALEHSFEVKGRRRPSVKKRHTTLPSLQYTAGRFRIRDRRLVLPKGIVIPIVWSRELPSAPSSVRICQDSLGYWSASFVVTRELQPAPAATGRIGIDWGVRTTATTTDPAYDLPYGGYRKRCAAELAKAQRRMARRRRAPGQAQSRGYREARRAAAKIQKKAAGQNAHTSRVWAAAVVDNHQTIAVEDFSPLFLAKSTMARKAADAAIGAAKRELTERGKRAGRKVVLVPPAYTTMTCSECGERQARLGLAERTFRCADCGYTADRDLNAARTILAQGERYLASADDVRRLPTSPHGDAAGAV